MPELSESLTPPSEHTPPCFDMPDLSPPLRRDLVQCFILGAADYMNGVPCTGDEPMPPSLATSLYDLAVKAVAGSETLIAQLYRESPRTTYETLYDVGYEAFQSIDEAVSPAPINLN